MLAAAAAALGLRLADVLLLVHDELLAAAERPLVLTAVGSDDRGYGAPYARATASPASSAGSVVALAA